ncbi:hypothetical protein BC941DRAFT_458631 [Chlamydoabsidia padenii]|nr:hypothetical protein BC941DRAFT_458631 [Chlamydoabsidia padenii]
MYRPLTRLAQISHATLSTAFRPQQVKLVSRYTTTATNYSKEFISVSHPTAPLNNYNLRLASVVRKYPKSKLLNQVNLIVEEIKQQNLKFDAVTYNTLLLAYTRAQQQDEAMKTLYDMIKEGFKPTVESYNIILQVINTSGRGNSVQLQKQVVDLMEENQVPLSAISYEYLLKGMARTQNNQGIVDTLALMKVKGVYPTLLAYGYAIRGCLDSNNATMAFNLMKEAEAANLPLQTEPRLLLDVLRVSALNDEVDETQYCWDKVVNTHGLRPDEGTCLQVLRVASQSADSKLATDVIRQLSNNGYPYKEHYFVPLMEAFVAKDDLKSAFDVLDIMRVSGVPPCMRSTFSVSQKISSNIDTVDKAYYLLEEMKKEGKTVDVTAFNIVIAACGLAKDIGRTVATFREAGNLGVVPDVDTFNAVLDACIQTDMKGMGQVVIDELKKAKITPNADTFSKMITLVCKQSNYEDAFVYLEEMKSLGMVPPQQSKKLAYERDPRFHIALEEMETYGYNSNAAHMKSLWK